MLPFFVLIRVTGGKIPILIFLPLIIVYLLLLPLVILGIILYPLLLTGGNRTAGWRGGTMVLLQSFKVFRSLRGLEVIIAGNDKKIRISVK